MTPGAFTCFYKFTEQLSDNPREAQLLLLILSIYNRPVAEVYILSFDSPAAARIGL